MTTTTAGIGMLGAIIGASLTVFAILGVVWFVLQVVAWWKIFTKAGEKGWKAIIPFYNYYVQIKLTWDKKFFWIIMIFSIVAGILSSIKATGTLALVLSIGALALYLAVIVLVIIGMYRLSKAYGHAGGWTVGLVFLETIFILMLGFGKSEYKGNVYLEEKNK